MPAPVRLIAQAAAKIITHYTLFQNPLPNGDETIRLLENAWTQAQDELETRGERLRPAETWV